MTFSRELADKRPAINDIFSNPEGLKMGDAAAWGTLFQALHPLLTTHALIQGARSGQVDDVTQETWIELERRFTSGDFDFSDKPLHYALKVNHSKVRNSQRRNKRFDRRSNPLPEQPTGAVTESSESEYLDGLVDERIVAALGQVSPLFLRPFLMIAIDDLSQADAARILGVKEDTVKTRVHRARTRLRELLDEEVQAAQAWA